MEYVCVLNCQIRINGHIHTIERGDVVDLDFDPKHRGLVAVDSGEYVLDFTKASRDELMSAKWKFSEAAKVMKDAYGVTLKREDGDKKSEVVEAILDIRYRSIDTTIVNPSN